MPTGTLGELCGGVLRLSSASSHCPGTGCLASTRSATEFMCGIAGIVGRADRQVVADMISVLVHRGPDGEGIIAPPGEPFAFGHRRLSIIDLSPAGSQPMSDPSGRYWINYNGEVYNYRALRAELEARGRCFRSKTDTEVVLAAYESWGEECLSRLNGMFAFAIWHRH